MRAPSHVLGLGLLGACASAGDKALDDTAFVDADPCVSGRPTLALGEGEVLFEPLAPGDSVVMVHGPQEGWHITGAIRAWNTDSIVRLEYQVTVPDFDDAVIVDQNYRFKLVPEEGCSGYQPALTGYIELDEVTSDEKVRPYEILAYKDVVMHMHLTDDNGVDLEESLTLTAVPDEQDKGMEP